MSLDRPQEYSPELADLMEHEKVIEQGIGTFREVGSALLAIRDGKKYRAAGYRTFDVYCLKRWEFTDKRAYQLMEAARDGIESSTPVELSNVPEPIPYEPPKVKHPAPFSGQILDTVASRVQGVDTVLDPFAGTGRVHELRERAGVINTIGVELEPEWAATHPDTIEGNALALPASDESVDAIVTSPAYGNRMADSHTPGIFDESTRHTYDLQQCGETRPYVLVLSHALTGAYRDQLNRAVRARAIHEIRIIGFLPFPQADAFDAGRAAGRAADLGANEGLRP